MSKIRVTLARVRDVTKKAKPVLGPVVSGAVSGFVRWVLDNLAG